ncbi:MAG: type II secretion system F family protein [Candidatus Pacearchaeota archaeon]
MTLEGLLSNIEREKEIISEVISLNEKFFLSNSKEEKIIIEKKINSLLNQLKILNESIPKIIENISPFREFPPFKNEVKDKKNLKKESSQELSNISYNSKGKQINIIINKKDKEKFLEELRISEEAIERLKEKKIKNQEDYSMNIAKSNFYKRISNKMFLNLSNSLLKKGYFIDLEKNLKKASIPFLTNSYLSMAFFSSFLSFILSIFFLIFGYFFLKLDLIKYIWIIFLLPFFTFFIFYFYPATESKSIETKIKEELPFVVLNMAAISSSKVEPSYIFKIIAFGKEYPNIKKEFIKVMNQINLYGYDLVTALKNVAKITPSKELSELFLGIGAIITTGGNITEFLEKRAETLFFEYKIEKEKYTKEAETFMDIYISLVIAAPMIFGLLIALMSTKIINIGFSSVLLLSIIIGCISIINIIFILFLNLKQTSY